MVSEKSNLLYLRSSLSTTTYFLHRAHVKLVGHCEGEVDISVLAADIQISPTYPLNPTLGGIILGQDVYFLGFPYSLKSDVGSINRNFPLPLVKKAIVSLVAERGHYILLDGHNNPGFSGGPVVFHPNNRGNDFCVAGVVAGYRHACDPVYKNKSKTKFQSVIINPTQESLLPIVLNMP